MAIIGMDSREKILQAFKSTLDNIDRKDLLAIIDEVDKLDVDGISMKEYLTTFDSHYKFLPFDSSIGLIEESILGLELLTTFYNLLPSKQSAPDYIFMGDPPRFGIKVLLSANPLDERVFC